MYIYIYTYIDVLTEGGSLRTIDVQWQVALFLFRAVVVEHHAVGTKLFRDLVVRARVVLVTLTGIREKAVGLWTLALQLLGRLVLFDYRPDGAGRGRPSPAAVARLTAEQCDYGNGPSHVNRTIHYQ